MPDLYTNAKNLLVDPVTFAELASGITLRSYQKQVAMAVFDSIVEKRGATFVVIFPRQSGKNEYQAQIEAYLLTLLSPLDAEMVKVPPPWKPQSLNAMRRLERVLSRNLLARSLWKKESGYIYKVRNARIAFLSGSQTANVVGATASVLLECDEAQDVLQSKWDKEINPMAASTNATKIFWGTAWTSQTLLAREMRAAREAEKLDGLQRVFLIDADLVRQEVPAYGKFVDAEIAKLGRNHPFVKTQYFCQEIDAESGMFPEKRIALMQGDHPMVNSPEDIRSIRGENPLTAALIDVGGEDRSTDEMNTGEKNRHLSHSDHDSTTLTIIQVDLSTLADPLINAPRYLAVNRYTWTGAGQTTLYQRIMALLHHWQPRHTIIDATGIGAGLASFLDKSFPGSVIPFTFSQKSKSDLAWSFISVIETGRYKEYKPIDITLLQQLTHCQLEVLPGPGRMARWGVPNGTRDPASGELVHDDYILSAALCSLLDEQQWGQAESAVIQPIDVLANLKF